MGPKKSKKDSYCVFYYVRIFIDFSTHKFENRRFEFESTTHKRLC